MDTANYTFSPRAYSYLRFSTPEQAKGDSLRRQAALADDYAKRHGLTLDTELNLRDLGISAYRGDNAAVGALGAFLRAVSDGLVPQGSLLLVEALDRISRQTARKAVRILEEIVEGGVTLVTLNDGRRYTEASLDGGDFLLAILMFMRGSDESAMKAKRLKASWVGKRERAALGEIQSVRVPAWIHATGSASKDSRTARLELHPERAAIVARIFDMFLAGQGKHATAEVFNAEGIPTWSAGKGHKPGKFWQATYVLKILANPAVTGRLVPHVESHDHGKRVRTAQTAVEGYYPRVIDDETFHRVQTLIDARRGSVRSKTVASIVAGLAKCPICGSTMTRIMKGKRGGVPKLLCTKAKAGAGCQYRLVKLSDVEQALIRNAEYLGKPPIAQSSIATDIDEADEQLFVVNKHIEALIESIERQPSAALSKRLHEREAEAESLSSRFQQLKALAAESESRVVALRATRLQHAAATLKPETVAAANAALRECVESVTVDYRQGVLRLAWRHGPVTELDYDWGFENLDRNEAQSASSKL